jgi:hypothetical protein
MVPRLINIAIFAAVLAPSLALAHPLPLARPPGPGGSCPHGYMSSGSPLARKGGCR